MGVGMYLYIYIYILCLCIGLIVLFTYIALLSSPFVLSVPYFLSIYCVYLSSFLCTSNIRNTFNNMPIWSVFGLQGL